MRSLITILFLSFLISSEAQNISQSQVRQFNAVSAYRVFGRGAGVGTPSFITLDSNHVPLLHSQGYYDLRYGSLVVQNGKLNSNFGTQGSVLFRGATGVSESNSSLFYDSTNSALKLTSLKSSGLAAPFYISGNTASGIGSGVGMEMRNTSSVTNKTQIVFGGGSAGLSYNRTVSIGVDPRGVGNNDFFIYNGKDSSNSLFIDSIGRVAVDNTVRSGLQTGSTASAWVTIRGSLAGASGTGSLKLKQGTLLTTPEDGLIEHDNLHFYGTIGSTRYQLDQQSVGGGGSGTVNSGTQYRIPYYATTGTVLSQANAITANRALISDANGVPTHSATTATELGYLSGATSNIQTQINAISGGTYTLPTASSSVLGGIKVGTGLAIDGTGVLSATAVGSATSGVPYSTASGTDTYAASFSPAFTSLATGITVRVLFMNTNTTTATLSIDGLAAKPIKKAGSVALDAGDIGAGTIYTLTYDGTNWQADIGQIGKWFDYVPSWTGFSTPPVINYARYTLIGKACFVTIIVTTAGTSNATTTTVTLPFAANKASQIGLTNIMNAGAVSANNGMIQTRAGSNVADAYSTVGGAVWSASGNKFLHLPTFTYEIQ